LKIIFATIIKQSTIQPFNKVKMNEFQTLKSENDIREACLTNNANKLEQLYLQNKKHFETLQLEEEFVWVCQNNFIEVAQIMLQIKPNLKLLFDEIIIVAGKEGNFEVLEWICLQNKAKYAIHQEIIE
jgi:hypothetical protein